ILQCGLITPAEFIKIAELAASYPNDPRMIEMVRKAGDASAKVPYLMEYGETPQSILAALREVAAPHVEYLKILPEPVQATIHTLLSINMVPTGYEAYGIPALLEINRMQKEMTSVLRGMMAGRKLAQEFHENNARALRLLDQEWHNVRKMNVPWPFIQSLPEQTQMQFIPKYYRDCLVSMREVCVIVDSPDWRELRSLTAPVLQNPLPEDEMAPVTGSADWLVRVVGKVGRHFTRALLDIIVEHLKNDRVYLDSQDYEKINFEAHDALRSYIERTP
ncbi:MAG: hypothetical protein IH586_23520, partial [Anaerolineaceae bacterium]|nr:hypothetical protein [Anaerolineaceae bacterium]